MNKKGNKQHEVPIRTNQTKMNDAPEKMMGMKTFFHTPNQQKKMTEGKEESPGKGKATMWL